MSMSVIKVVPGIQCGPAGPSTAQAIWAEKNCYVDLWTGLLGALGLEARACMPVALAVDFLGDQWTFFKPCHHDLRDLYGIDVQELTVWRPLLDHAEEHVSAGRLIATESDAFWLPDTAGTDYRTKHTKTTILINEVDRQARRLGYFHNMGYHVLSDEDFDRTFRLNEPVDGSLPLFAELVVVDRLVRHSPEVLREMSLRLLDRYIARRPLDNPVARFADRFRRDLPQMQASGLDHYHAWAFAATRQLGSACEVVAQNLRWIGEQDPARFDDSAQHFEDVAALAKSFILKGARAVTSKRAFDDGGMLAAMALAWERGIESLTAARFDTSIHSAYGIEAAQVEFETGR